MGMGGNSSGFSMSFGGPGGGVQSSSFSRYKFSKNTKKIEAGGGGCKSYFFLLLVRIFKSQWPITYCLYIVTIFRRACT